MLDLGVLVATATMDTAAFDRGYIRTVGKFKGLSDQALKTAETMLRLDESFAGAGKAATSAAGGIERAAKASTTSASAEDKAAVAARAHAKALAQVSGILADVAGEDKRVQAATLRVTAAQERLNAVTESGTATTRQLASAQAGLIGAQRSLAAASKTTTEAVVASGGAMKGMIRTAGELGLIFGGIEIAKKAIEFVTAGRDLTTALNGVQAAARATDAQMVKVRAEALALGRDMKVPGATAVDAAQAIDDLVRAGMKLPRAMAAARPALLLAAAAQVDTADAARYLGDTLDDFALKANQAGHVANSLAGAATSAGGGLTDMFTALSYAGPYARAVGVDVDSVVASIAELAKSGIQGSRAGSGIARMLQSLANPSDKAKKALADLGVQAWDTRGRFVGLASLYDQLHTSQQRMGVDAERFGRDIAQAFGARAATAVTVFAHRGIEGYNQFAARVKSGDVQKYADLMNRGVSADLAALGKRFTAAGIAIWDHLEPAAKAASHWFAYELPHDIGVVMGILGPFIHMVGTGLVGAWHLAGDALHVVGAMLGGTAHFLSEHATLVRLVGTAVLGMWAAYKGYRIVTFAMDAISVAFVNGRANVAKWRAGVTESLTGVQAQAAATSATMQADALAAAQADIDAQLIRERAAAADAAAYADMVAASDNATAMMVANAVAQANAAQATADATAVAAGEVAAASDAAAAAVTTAGEEATIGWSAMLGPLGLVIGALAAVGLATHHSGDSAATAAAQTENYKQQVQGLTSAIKEDSGALGANTRAYVANALQKSGVLAAARRAGYDLHDVLMAAIGDQGALARVHAHTSQILSDGVRHLAGDMDLLGNKTKTTAQIQRQQMTDAAVKVNDAVRGTNREVRSATDAYHNTNDALKGVNRTTSATTSSSMALTGALHVAATAADRQKDALDRDKEAAARLKDESLGLKGALEAVAGILDKAAAAIAFQQGVNDLTKSMKDNKGAIDGQSAAALSDRASFISLAQQVVQQAQTMRQHGASVQKVTGYIRTHIDALKAATIAGGADKTAVDNLTASLHLIPAEIRSEIYLNTTDALSKVAYLAGQIKQLGQNMANADTTGSMSLNLPTPKKPNAGGHATGGGLPDGFSVVGEGGPGARPELVHKSGSSVQVFSNPQSKAIVAATGMVAPGFAGGTVRSQVMAQIRDPRVRLAMLMAPFLEGGGRSPLGSGGWGVGDGGHSYGPYQINLPYHPGVTPGKATDPAFAVHYMSGAYRAAVASVPRSMWADQPAMAARLAIFRAERPQDMYSASAAAAAFRAVHGMAGATGGGHGGHGGHGGGAGGGGGSGNGGGNGGGGVTHLPGSGGNPPVVQRLTGGGLTGATTVAKVPMDIYRVGNGYGWNGNYYAKHKDAVAARRDALHQAAAQRLDPAFHHGRRGPLTVTDRIGGPHGITGVAKILNDNKAAAVKAMRDLAKAVNAAWDLKGVEKSITQTRATIKSMRGDLQGMRQYQAGIQSTYAGNFDPTQYGTIGGLIGGLHGQTRTDNRIAGQITRLRHEHLNRGWLNRLIQGNQTGLISMLAGSDPASIARLNRALAGYQSSLGAIGGTAEVERFGKTLDREEALIAKQRKHVDRLITREDKIATRVDRLTDAVEKLTGRPVELLLPDGSVLARSTGRHHANALRHRIQRGSGNG